MNQKIKKVFLPLNCLKSFILIGALLTISVGVLSTFLITYAFLMSSFWIVFSRQIRNILMICFLLACNLIILSGVAGLYGVLRKKNIFLSIYSISIFVYIILFIVLGLFATLYPKHLLYNCDSPNGQAIQQTVKAANETLCRQDCQCYFDDFQAYNSSQRIILKKDYLSNYNQTNTSLPVTVTNCEVWKNSTYPFSYELYLLESFFNCSGWCPGNQAYNLLFFFTNVNNGPPVDFCYNSLSAIFKKFGLAIVLSSFLVSGILFIVFLTLICLCFHPQRARSESNPFHINLVFDASFTSDN